MITALPIYFGPALHGWSLVFGLVILGYVAHELLQTRKDRKQ